jgi:hypothetical protein
VPSYFKKPPFITKLQPGEENSIFSNSDLDLGPTGLGMYVTHSLNMVIN